MPMSYASFFYTPNYIENNNFIENGYGIFLFFYEDTLEFDDKAKNHIVKTQ